MQLDAETSHDLGQPRGLFPFRVLLVIAECVPIRYVLALRSAEASLDEAALNGVAAAFESCKRFDLFLAQFQDGGDGTSRSRCKPVSSMSKGVWSARQRFDIFINSGSSRQGTLAWGLIVS